MRVGVVADRSGDRINGCTSKEADEEAANKQNGRRVCFRSPCESAVQQAAECVTRATAEHLRRRTCLVRLVVLKRDEGIGNAPKTSGPAAKPSTVSVTPNSATKRVRTARTGSQRTLLRDLEPRFKRGEAADICRRRVREREHPRTQDDVDEDLLWRRPQPWICGGSVSRVERRRKRTLRVVVCQRRRPRRDGRRSGRGRGRRVEPLLEVQVERQVERLDGDVPRVLCRGAHRRSARSNAQWSRRRATIFASPRCRSKFAGSRFARESSTPDLFKSLVIPCRRVPRVKLVVH